MAPGCDLTTTYLLFAVSPQAILAYVAEGLFAPLIVFLWGKKKGSSRRRIVGLFKAIDAWVG